MKGKSFLSTAFAACFGVLVGQVLAPHPAAAKSTTLFGTVHGGVLRQGAHDLSLEFRDPRTDRLVATTPATGIVRGSSLIADLKSSGLPDGVYALTVRSAAGTAVQDPTFVQLQTNTPGTQQTGNINVSGTILAGKIGVPTANAGAQINGISSTGLIGVRGQSNATGVVGAANGANGVGISGVVTSTTGPTSGVVGNNASPDGFGVRGIGGPGVGGRFTTTGPNQAGIVAEGPNAGVFNAVGNGQAVVANSDFIGLRAQTSLDTGVGVDTQGFLGVRALANSQSGTGVLGSGFFGGDFTGTTGLRAVGSTVGISAIGTETGGKFVSPALGTGLEAEGGFLGGKFLARAIDSAAVKGISSALTSNAFGGDFESKSATGRGVRGLASATAGANFGGWFATSSTAGVGAIGSATATSGNTIGLFGTVSSTSGRGVVGEAKATSGNTIGGDFAVNSSSGTGLRARATATSGATVAGLFTVASPNGVGVRAESSDPSGAAVSARNLSEGTTVTLGGPQGSIHTTGSLHVVGKTSKNYGSARRSFAPAAFGTISMPKDQNPVIVCSSGNITAVRVQNGEVEIGVNGFSMSESNSCMVVTDQRFSDAAVMSVAGGTGGRWAVNSLDINLGTRSESIRFSFVIYDCRSITLGDTLAPEDNTPSPPR